MEEVVRSKIITISLSDEIDHVFHYRVCGGDGYKELYGWPGEEFGKADENNTCEITDISDLRLWQFHLLYQQLAIHGHLLDLEQTVCNQKPVFADENWKIAKLMGEIEKE